MLDKFTTRAVRRRCLNRELVDRPSRRSSRQKVYTEERSTAAG